MVIKSACVGVRRIQFQWEYSGTPKWDSLDILYNQEEGVKRNFFCYSGTQLCGHCWGDVNDWNRKVSCFQGLKNAGQN